MTAPIRRSRGGATPITSPDTRPSPTAPQVTATPGTDGTREGFGGVREEETARRSFPFEGFIRQPFPGLVDESFLNSYSNQNPTGYRFARQQAAAFLGDVPLADVTAQVNWAAAKYKADIGIWPSGSELLGYTPFLQSLGHLDSGAANFDRFFWLNNDDGTRSGLIYNDGFQYNSIGDMNEILQSFTGQPRLRDTPGPEGETLLPGVGARFGAGRATREFFDQFTGYTQEEIDTILPTLALPGPSGGAGSGGGRAPTAFDRRHLMEQINSLWQRRLLELPSDAESGRIADAYAKEANAFWMSKAGQLDFETYVMDQIRATSRWKMLYTRKPNFQSEEEYMTGFRNVLAGQGINEQATLRELEAGASSGTGLAGFSERVGRTREARLTNVGGFGNQLAGNMAATGIGRT